MKRMCLDTRCSWENTMIRCFGDAWKDNLHLERCVTAGVLVGEGVGVCLRVCLAVCILFFPIHKSAIRS